MVDTVLKPTVYVDTTFSEVGGCQRDRRGSGRLWEAAQLSFWCSPWPSLSLPHLDVSFDVTRELVGTGDSRALADCISPARGLFLRSPSIPEAHQSLQSSGLVLSTLLSTLSLLLSVRLRKPVSHRVRERYCLQRTRICYNFKKMHLVQHAFLLGICVTPLCLQR